jgi:predicted RNase H-like nuclease (RuvC/YqgF family)
MHLGEFFFFRVALSAQLGAENATSLHRNSDVAPKKLEQCSFALDIKEHKQVRTYYLSAHSEGEKKQWLDAMLASKKWYAAQAAAIANPGPSAKGGRAAPAASGEGGGASTAKLEQELEEAEARVKKLLVENKSLKQQLEEKGKGGNHEEMLLELEEMEERYEQEKKKRIALEKQAGSGKAGMVDEAELEALRDKYEEEIRFLKSQHQKDLRLSVKGKLPAQQIKKADSGDEDFDVPEFDDSYEEKSPRPGAAKSPAFGKGNSNADALQREVEALKKENAKLKSQPAAAPGKGGKAAAAAADPEVVQELRDEIQELNELVQKLSLDVAELQGEKQDLEKQLQSKSAGGGGGGGGSSAKLQAENDELRNQIGDFEKQLDELEAGMANKNRTIRDLEAKVKAGGGKAGGGGGGGGGGSAEADELRKKLELMEGVLEDLEQEIQDMKTTNEDLTGKLQKAEAAAKKGGGGGAKGNSDLEAENARLEEELAEAQNQASQYKAKLGLLRSEYKKLLSSTQQKK